MNGQFYLQMTWTVVLTLFGVILWGATLTHSPHTDLVTLYTLGSDAPDFNAFRDQAMSDSVRTNGISAAAASLAVWYSINSTCISPDTVQDLIRTDPGFIANPAFFPSAPQTPGNPATLGRIYNTPKLLTSPLCRCLAMTLFAFVSKNPTTPLDPKKLEAADEAYKACFSTHTHTPQHRQWYSLNYNTQKIQTRKSVSKVTFALIICLSFLFSFIYNSLDFEAEHFYSDMYNRLKLGFLLLIAALQMFLPMASQGHGHGSTLIAFSALVIVPSLLIQFILMEMAWAYLETQRRSIHIHPYVMSTTLISLNAIALFETGVFDFRVFMHYTFISHALAVAYAGTLFFVSFQKDETTPDAHTLAGYTILIAASTLLVINCAIPSHPTTDNHALMWMLPPIFTVCVFGISIFIEHTYGRCKEGVQCLAETTKHTYFTGHALLVMIVLGHFMIELWHVSLGDKILGNAGGMLPRLNFAFLTEMNPNFPTLYSIP